MAAVLDALTSYVTELIVDMVKEDLDTLLGVSGEINKPTLPTLKGGASMTPGCKGG